MSERKYETSRPLCVTPYPPKIIAFGSEVCEWYGVTEWPYRGSKWLRE